MCYLVFHAEWNRREQIFMLKSQQRKMKQKWHLESFGENVRLKKIEELSFVSSHLPQIPFKTPTERLAAVGLGMGL